MSTKHTFSTEVREKIVEATGGHCLCSEECTHLATEFHHILANTKVNQKLFPHFIQSIFNCCPINHACHMTKPLPRVSLRMVEAFEWYLQSISPLNEPSTHYQNTIY